jgi:TRAP-type uncharacterized transport system substrate-binding protein
MRESLRRLFRASNPPAGPMKKPFLVVDAQDSALRDSFGRRLRIMMSHTWLIVIATLLLVAGIGGASYYFATLPTQLKIAVGPPGSEDERVVEEIAHQMREDRPALRGIRLTLLRKDNTTETAKALEKGEAHLAVVRRDINMPKDGQVVAILRKNVVALWALPPEPKPEPPKVEEKPAPKPAAKTAKAKRAAAAKAAAEKTSATKKTAAKKSDDDDDDDEKSAKDSKKAPRIEKVEQLIGKRVGIIGRSQANLELFRVIVAQYGIPSELVATLSTDEERKSNDPGKISIVQLPVDKVATTIREMKVDAVMSVGPLSSPVTTAAIAASRRDKDAPNFLDIKAAEAIEARYPVYESTEIKAGAFGGAPQLPEEEVETVGVNHYIVARKNLSEDIVADFTRNLFAIRQSLSARLPAAAKIEAPDTSKDAAVPVHPGAAAYIDGDLKTFFDRYNDLLYWGIMLMSFFGSGIAGVLSYTKADDRVRRLKFLEQLLELTRAARTAESIQAIDELQTQADDILGAMIHEVEAKTIDDSALTAFQVSMDQAQTAISDRRATLLGLPMRPRPAVAAL